MAESSVKDWAEPKESMLGFGLERKMVVRLAVYWELWMAVTGVWSLVVQWAATIGLLAEKGLESKWVAGLVI